MGCIAASQQHKEDKKPSKAFTRFIWISDRQVVVYPWSDVPTGKETF